MEAQAIAPAMYEWNDATFHACVAVAGALASITTNKDFNEAALVQLSRILYQSDIFCYSASEIMLFKKHP